MTQERPHNPHPGDPDLQDAVVDAICDQFEAAWLSKKNPRIEDYLSIAGEAIGQRLVNELLLAEFDLRKRNGERPDRGDYLRRFPAQADLINGALDQRGADSESLGHDETKTHGQLDGIGCLRVRCPQCNTSVEMVVDTPLAEITCSSCGNKFSLVDDSADKKAPTAGTTLGQFELLEKVGVGGFGSVWKAQDKELDRIVSIKIPRRGQLDAVEIEQFLREARAAAQLSHPNIVSIHEVGRDGETIYIVSDFVHGVSLSDYLAGHRFSPREAATLCAAIGEALHHAHQNGVIHRDLKPSNIIMDARERPHLTDFGLARREVGEVTMTWDGQVLGTPAYMSPELAQGEAHRADRRSDLYSLGVILFELLTGELPFRGNARMLIHQVIHEEAPSPRKLNGNVPRDLETICLKCLEKDPRKRFASAVQVSEELGRFLRGETLEVRPISTLARAWRWCKRKPAMSSLAAGLVVTLLAGLVGVTSQWIRADKEAERANLVANENEQARREAAARAEEADRARRRSDQLSLDLAIDRGVSLCEQASVGHGLLWLAHALEIAPADARDLRRVIRTNLADWHCELHTVRVHLAHPDRVWAVAFNADGNIVVTGCMDGKARLWDADTGEQLIAAPLDQGAEVRGVAISPDGSRILTGGRFTACLWDARSGKLIRTIEEQVEYVAFSPDGKRFAAGCWDGTARVFDAGTARPIGKPLRHESEGLHDCVAEVVFSLDGSLILTGSTDETARVWDARTHNAIGEPLEHQSWVIAVAFSPDGLRFLTGCLDGTIRLWDVDTQKVVSESSGNRATVHSVAFNADGTRILTGRSDNTAQLWDAVLKNPVGPPLHHQGSVMDVEFSPKNDGTCLTGSEDGMARIWEPAAQRLPSETFQLHHEPVMAVAFSPDGSCLVTGSADGTAQIWNLDAQRTTGKVFEHQGTVSAAAFSADGSRILTGCGDGSAQLWDAITGETIGSPLWHRGGPGEVWAVAFSPTDETVAMTGSIDNTASLWQLTTGKRLRTFPHGGTVGGIAFGPDGKRILTACHDFNARVWDVATGELVGGPLKHRGMVRAVAFSPDGSCFATGCSNDTAYLWNARTYEPIGKPLKHEGHVLSVSFSPDGTLLLTGSWDQTARFWDVATSKPIGVPLRHEAPVRAVAFGPAGKKIATACFDGRVYLWDPPSEPLTGNVEQTVLWTQVITGLELDGAGAIRNLDTPDWNDRRQRLHELGDPPSW